MNHQLDAIRAAGYFVGNRYYHEVFQLMMSYPVFQNQDFAGALGASFPMEECPGDRKQELMEATQTAAKELSLLLSKHTLTC